MHPNSDDLVELERVLSLPADHPERVKYEARPDFAALSLGFQKFVTAEDVEGAQPEAAEATLSQFVSRNMAQALGPQKQRPDNLLDRLQMIFGSWLRPAVLAPVAVLAVAFVAFGLWQPQPGNEPVLRSIENAPTVSLSAPVFATNGNLTLSWQPVTGADAYLVRLLGADFSELQEIGPTSNTMLEISADKWSSMGTVRFWLVEALQAGDAIQRSAVEVLE